jgi:hypothetical protein
VLALSPEGVKADRPLLTTRAALVLEGLEFHRDGDDGPAPGGRRLIYSERGPVALANCRAVLRSRATGFIGVVRADEPSSVQVRNCQFLGDWYGGMDWQVRPDSRAVVANCQFLANHHAVNVSLWSAAPNASVRLLNNTIVSRGEAANIQFNPLTGPGPAFRRTAVPLEARRNACSSGLLHFACWCNPQDADGITERELRSQSRQLLALEDQGNRLGAVPDLARFAVISQPAGYSRRGTITTLDEWRDFCTPGKTDAVVGPIPFRAQDLSPDMAAPEKLTPDDFRLQADGPGGEGLGADVDLVGPGPAYEKWKATPDYQQWRAETGRMMAAVAVRPFVVLSPGKPERRFPTLAEAAAGAASGDVIEFRGDGPFVSPPVDLQDKALTIRAGTGYRPVLQLRKDDLPPFTPLLRTAAALVLEGLELRRDDRDRAKAAHVEFLVESGGASIRLANCRFVTSLKGSGGAVLAKAAALFEARNCLFVGTGRGSFATWVCRNGGQLVLENNVVVTGGNVREQDIALLFHYRGDTPRDVSLRLAHNTCAAAVAGLYLDTHPNSPAARAGRADPPLRLDATDNVFAAPSFVFAFAQDQRQYVPDARVLPPAEAEALLRELLAWGERRNVYLEGVAFLWLGDGGSSVKPTRPRTALADWEQFWGLKDTGSVRGPVRFRGGDVRAWAAAAPDRLTPDDLRLAADSKGARAGDGGRDLGADIDLVGPGAAYERWKKTPEYQQWLKGAAKPK